MVNSTTDEVSSSSRATVLLIILCITYACVVQYAIVMDMAERPHYQALPKHLFRAETRERLFAINHLTDDYIIR
jgi:hypothetical protein